MAIARDATGRKALSGAPATLAFTTAGSNRFLVVFVSDDQGAGPSDVSYAGVSMTQILNNGGLGTEAPDQYCYVLANPTIGANNIVVTAGTDSVGILAISYTGVKQSGQPEATDASSGTFVGTTATNTLTTIADNAWTVSNFHVIVGKTVTASTGSHFLTNLTNAADGTVTNGIYDSNGAVTPAGSHSMSVTINASNQDGIRQMISLAPAPPFVPGASFLFNMI